MLQCSWRHSLSLLMIPTYQVGEMISQCRFAEFVICTKGVTRCSLAMHQHVIWKAIWSIQKRRRPTTRKRGAPRWGVHWGKEEETQKMMEEHGISGTYASGGVRNGGVWNAKNKWRSAHPCRREQRGIEEWLFQWRRAENGEKGVWNEWLDHRQGLRSPYSSGTAHKGWGGRVNSMESIIGAPKEVEERPSNRWSAGSRPMESGMK